MKTASIGEVKSRLGAIVDESKDEPVVITRNGRPVAVLYAVTDEDELERLLLASSRRFQEVLEVSRQQFLDGHGIKHEDFWKSLEEDPPPAPAKPPRRKKA